MRMCVLRLIRFLHARILCIFPGLQLPEVYLRFDIAVRHKETYVRLCAYSQDAQRWAKIPLSKYPQQSPQQSGKITGVVYEVPHDVYHEIRHTVLWPCPCPFEFSDPTFINPVEFFKIGESFRIK